jgi:hypothetical protein
VLTQKDRFLIQRSWTYSTLFQDRIRLNFQSTFFRADSFFPRKKLFLEKMRGFKIWQMAGERSTRGERLFAKCNFLSCNKWERPKGVFFKKMFTNFNRLRKRNAKLMFPRCHCKHCSGNIKEHLLPVIPILLVVHIYVLKPFHFQLVTMYVCNYVGVYVCTKMYILRHTYVCMVLQMIGLSICRKMGALHCCEVFVR